MQLAGQGTMTAPPPNETLTAKGGGAPAANGGGGAGGGGAPRQLWGTWTTAHDESLRVSNAADVQRAP